MRCKKHLIDLSSSVGVCASCLRERLFALVAAQAQSQAVEDHRKYDSQPPPLVFPRSVSPYISRRKSDNAAWPSHHHHHHPSLSDQRFYSTPQVGPIGVTIGTASTYRKKNSKLSFFSNLFRSKSRKIDLEEESRVSVSNSRESCTSTAVTASPSWFSSMLSGRRKKQSRLFSLDESHAGTSRRPYGYRDRGMSPARYSQDGVDEECHGEYSGYSSEASQGWRETPTRASHSVRRGGGRPYHSRNVSGMAFCLSPLVRASPNRQWNQKGMPPEMSLPGGETRAPVKPHLSNAASYCANRSRKLTDFGRFNPNH